MFTQPSHVVSSHSSAINLEKTVSEKLFDGPEEYVKSDSQENLGKIPSPIKPAPRKLGLFRKPSQSSLPDIKPSQSSLSEDKPVQTSSNKWISTQSQNSQKSKKVLGSGSKKHPVKIGLMPTSQSKKQRTLNCFVKTKTASSDTNGETKSKYF